MKIAVVATSSVVSPFDLAVGLDRLRASGADVVVGSNCTAEHFLFAGNDADRAEQFYAAAVSDADVLWCANGGYGAARLLPLLIGRPMPPAKTLIGYSDVTAMLSFVRVRWAWRTIHAPMVASGAIDETLRWLEGPSIRQFALRWLVHPPSGELRGKLIGGNLAVWTSLIGTPFAESAAGKLLFLEDIDEPAYRIDRLVTQLSCGAALNDVRAIVLGTFTCCGDQVRQVRSTDGSMRPLRRSWPIEEALAETFGRLCVPTAIGLPIGHGGEATPLALGVEATLNGEGVLTVNY